MNRIIDVDPFRCRVWRLHSRPDAAISPTDCEAEIASFRRDGQLVPVLGRPLSGDYQHDIELIYGARRLFVARYLRMPLLAEVRELTDREALIVMDAENRLRQDISPYERGLSYARWLKSGHFASQEDIATALNVSTSQISRLLRLARLPAVVVNAFPSPAQICENWGIDLADALDDPSRRPATLRIARMLGNYTPRLDGSDVYRQLLMSPVRGRRPKPQAHDRVVLSASGAPLFRIRLQRNSIALILPADRASQSVLEEIETKLIRLLTVNEVETLVARCTPLRINAALTNELGGSSWDHIDDTGLLDIQS